MESSVGALRVALLSSHDTDTAQSPAINANGELPKTTELADTFIDARDVLIGKFKVREDTASIVAAILAVGAMLAPLVDRSPSK